MAWTYTPMLCALYVRRCSTIQGISVHPSFVTTAKAYSVVVTSLSAVATTGGSLTTKASLQGCSCPTAAVCCQVDYRLLDWTS